MKPIALTLALISPAHSWYPLYCCSEHDCHPVEGVVIEESFEGYQVGEDFAPRSKVKPSQDGHYHICKLNGYVICFFVPLNT